jgi:uncharacterized protein DUF6644
MKSIASRSESQGAFLMELDHVLAWLQATAVAQAISENEILFPWIESVHVLAIVLVVGTISIVDLRLLGVASLNRDVSRVMRDVLPYTWGAFIIAATTGFLLFSSNAMTYAHNFFFRGKLILLAMAGLNMAVFHFTGIGDVGRWGATRQTPPAAKTAAAVSLLIWIAVVTFGRWIGFTLH